MRMFLMTICMVIAGSAFAFSPNGDGSIADYGLEIGQCSAAGADDYLELCNRFNTQQGAAECVATGNGQYFATCALDICGRFTTENGALECLRSTCNKDFTTDEIAICGRFTTEAGALDCLRGAGRPHQGGNVPPEVRLLILDALDYLDQQRYRRAEAALEEALEVIDRGPRQ